MILTQILQPECIKVPLEGKDKVAVITELVDLLDKQGSLSDRNLVLESVLLREKTRSTGIGAGVAIPHGKCKGVNDLVMAMGITASPIDFDSADGNGVSIISLLVSPVDKTGPHIQMLARISRLMLDEPLKKKIEQATSATALYDIIRQKETQQ
jgi:mannitol/fructose-specific phosphotransferase system IIA component (Ntr-type)